MNILFKGQFSDEDFSETYEELYRLFVNIDRIVNIDFVIQDKQSLDNFKSSSKKHTERLIKVKILSINTCKHLYGYLQNGIDFTGFKQQEKDQGLIRSLIVAEDIQAANWLWLGADLSVSSEDKKNVMKMGIDARMPKVIAYQVMLGEDPTLIPEELKENVMANLPHSDVKNIFFEEKALWFTLLNSKKETALHHAAQTGNIEFINLLIVKLDEKFIDRKEEILLVLDCKDKYGNTALNRAAQNGHTNVVGILVGRGADINAKNNSGRTSLNYAAAMGNTDMVQLLLKKGAVVDAKYND